MSRVLPCLRVVADRPANIRAPCQTFARDHQVLGATSGERALAMCLRSSPTRCCRTR